MKVQDAPLKDQFSCFGSDQSMTFLNQNLLEVLLIFFPISLLLAWLLHRRFPGVWVLLRSIVATGATVLLIYPIKYAAWLRDPESGSHSNDLFSALFHFQDIGSLVIIWIPLFVGTLLLSIWLRAGARLNRVKVQP